MRDETFKAIVNKIFYPKETPDPGQRIFMILAVTLSDGRKATAKGEANFLPSENDHVELTGQWTAWQGQMQFRFSRIKYDIPVDERSMLAYACEKTQGIGPAIEQEIWEVCGEDWRNVARYDVRRLSAAVLLRFRERVEDLDRQKEQSEAIAWLINLGLTSHLAEAAWTVFKGNLVSTVEANPYALVQVPGLGFRSVDSMVREKFGVSGDDPRRISAAIHCYANGRAETTGESAVAWEPFWQDLCQEIPDVDQDIILAAVAKEMGHFFKTVGNDAIARAKDFDDEMAIFSFL